jgi:predicted nucleotidyltransferase component of viral defense system
MYGNNTAHIAPKNILVEYLQYEILDSMFKHTESRELSFMGGTAIRMGYEGNRFSEDLDFDNFGLSFDDFSHLLEQIALDMRLKGFIIEIRLVEAGAYHCYIKFPNILFDNKLSDVAGEKILVRIDTVRKEKIFTPQVLTLNRFDIYRDILINPETILLSQKLIALCGRKKERGRDFYDVSFLYAFAEPDFAYIEAVTAEPRAQFIQKLLVCCEKYDYDTLAKDVLPFLTKPEQADRVRHFKKFIRQNLAKNLQ